MRAFPEIEPSRSIGGGRHRSIGGPRPIVVSHIPMPAAHLELIVACLNYERIKWDVRISSPIMSVRCGLQPNGIHGPRTPDKQLRMLCVRYDHGKLEYGLGASLPPGRRADRDESRARSSGQRLIFCPRFLASLDGQWSVIAPPSAFIGDKTPVAVPPHANRSGAHAKKPFQTNRPFRTTPRRARKAPASGSREHPFGG